MPVSFDNSNYINNDPGRVGYNGTASAGSVRGGHGMYTAAGRESLSAGSTITGEIIAKDGNEVTLRLGNDQTISAKLSGNADIQVGMKMTFEVAKGANDQMALRPLYSNLANNNAAMSALKAAGLPVNDTTLAMTDKMMSESMPVNRNALVEMFRNVSAHQNVSPESIVQMTKLNMPLTDTNVVQFDNYRNFEHQITGDLQKAAQGVADLFNEAVTAAADPAADNAFGGLTPGEVINEVLDLIDTQSLETIEPYQNADMAVAADAAGTAAAQTGSGPAVMAQAGTESAETLQEAENAIVNGADKQIADSGMTTVKNAVDGLLSNIKGMFNPGTDSTEPAQINENLSLTGNEQTELSNSLQDILSLAGKDAAIGEPLDPSQVLNTVKELVAEYPPDEMKAAEAELSAYSAAEAEMAEEEINPAGQDAARLTGAEGDKAVSDGTAAGKPVTDGMTAESSAAAIKAKVTGKLNEMLRSDAFGKLLKDSVKAQMSVKPEDVSQKGKIEELYERIQRTSSKISHIMESIGRSDHPAAQASGALSDNVSFMNQLNEFVNYVQLPLKMAGEDANGELYVYTKKKNLSDNNGNFSALLHLDMEHLGPMDIYVTMRDYTKVSTNFYLQSEDLLDFIEAHIDELTERLTKKGYDTSMRVTKKDPGTPITPMTDEFMKDEIKEDVKVVVSKMRFDVRA